MLLLILLLSCTPPKFDSATTDSAGDSAPYAGPPEITALTWTCADGLWTILVEARGQVERAELGFTSPTLQVVGEFGHGFPATTPHADGDRAGHHGEGWSQPLLTLEVAPEIEQGARTGYACEDQPEMSVSVALEDAEGAQLHCWMEGVDVAFHAELLDEGYGVYDLSDCAP